MHKMWQGGMLASTLFDIRLEVMIYMSLTDHQRLPVGWSSRGDVHVYLQEPKLETLMILSG